MSSRNLHATCSRRRFASLMVGMLLLLSKDQALRAASPAEPARTKLILCADSNLFFAPYVWKRIQTNAGVQAVQLEATMPGAYLKAAVEGSANIGLVID